MFKTVQVNTLELTFNLYFFLVHNQIIYKQDCLITFNFRIFFLMTFNINPCLDDKRNVFHVLCVLYIVCSTAT